jgi:hypothetical protein
MMSVGYNSRHAMWRHPHTGSVTQYRACAGVADEELRHGQSITNLQGAQPRRPTEHQERGVGGCLHVTAGRELQRQRLLPTRSPVD